MLSKKVFHKKNIIQFGKYFAAGITAFAVDFGILNGLIYIFKVNPYLYIPFAISIDNLFSTLIGAIVSYLLNKYFAFQSKKSVAQESGKFILVVVFNYILSNILFGILVSIVGGIFSASHITVVQPETLAKIITIGLQMIWTFFLYKLFVFKDPEVKVETAH